MASMKRFSFLLLLCFLYYFAFTQDQHLVDSLEARLKELRATDKELGKLDPTIEDSLTANVLNRLGKAFMETDTAKAMAYLQRELVLSERIGYELGVCRSLNNMASLNVRKLNYVTAVDQLERSLTIARKIGNRRTIKSDLVILGQMHHHQGQYSEALEHMLESSKLFEEDVDRKELAQAYNNIASVYQKVGNYDDALKMSTASLRVREELGDSLEMAQSHFNIGKMHYILNNDKAAKESYEVALLFYQRKTNKRGIASCLREMGVLAMNAKDHAGAMELTLKALAIDEEIGNTKGMVSDQNSIGLIHERQGRHGLALTCFRNVLQMAEGSGDLTMLASACNGLSASYAALGRPAEALDYYRTFIVLKDSLSNTETAKKITQLQMQHDFDQKEALAKAEQMKKDLLAEEEIQRQKFVRNGFIGGFGVVLLFAGVFFRQRNKIAQEKKTSEAEKERSEQLLLNILPEEVAEELKRTGRCQPKTFSMVTVLFADFKDFTSVSEKISGELLVHEIDTCFKGFDAVLEKHRIEKIKTVGDAYICASGLPTLNYTHAVDMVAAALEIRAFMIARKAEKEARGEIGFELRIGIHTGPVVAGIVGDKKFSYDIWGDTVNMAARMEQSGEAGKINISGSTFELVKDNFYCSHRGKIWAKNKGELDMYFVESK